MKDKVVYLPCTTTLIRKRYGTGTENSTLGKSVAVNMAFYRVAHRFGKKDVICTAVFSTKKKPTGLLSIQQISLPFGLLPSGPIIFLYGEGAVSDSS